MELETLQKLKKDLHQKIDFTSSIFNNVQKKEELKRNFMEHGSNSTDSKNKETCRYQIMSHSTQSQKDNNKDSPDQND